MKYVVLKVSHRTCDSGKLTSRYMGALGLFLYDSGCFMLPSLCMMIDGKGMVDVWLMQDEPLDRCVSRLIS